MSNRSKVILGVVVVGVVALVIIQGRLASRIPRTMDIEGTITQIDLAERKASVEFIAPWDGERKEKRGSVPADCEIQLDGKPAQLADLHPGYYVAVKVELDKDTKEIRPLVIQARTPRPGSPTTRPAAASGS